MDELPMGPLGLPLDLTEEECAEVEEEVEGKPIPADLDARRARLLREKAELLSRPDLDLQDELDRINRDLETLGQHPTRN